MHPRSIGDRPRRKRRLLLALTAALTACAILAASALSYHRVVVYIIGPKTPKARSTHGMKMKITPRKAPAGTTFKGKACCFKPNEYVAVWQYKGRRSSQLNGGFANRRGRMTVYPDTAAGISKGRRKVCVQGLRTKRVACANFKVLANGGGTGPGYEPPTTGPGYEPPTTGPGYVPPGSG